jgi:two-component system chemotaxis response regulator CheB
VIRVLIVDDSALMRKLLGQALGADAGFEVEFARDGEEALDRLKSFKPDVVTLDIHMPKLDGLACLDRIMLERPCPVIMVSSLTAEGAEATLEALRLGAFDFVAKPEGAVSMRFEALASEIVDKVRAAAGSKPRLSRRLAERVRHRIGAAAPAPGRPRSQAAPVAAAAAENSEGVVVVGVSTGGPPALEALLTPLPAEFPWPILVAQHMPATFTGPLARRLDGLCALQVQEVLQPTPVEPGGVYIGRGDADLVVSRRGTQLVALAAPADRSYPWHPSADRLVRSAMEHLPAANIIGVLMTGMGYDGAEAMTRLREDGGRTIAESRETAVIWGMPGELVKAGGATEVAPLHRIAERLQRLVA